MRENQKDREDQKGKGVIPSERGSTIDPVGEQPRRSLGRISTINGSLQTGQKEKRFVELIILRQFQDGTVKTDKDRNLHNTGKASSQGID